MELHIKFHSILSSIQIYSHNLLITTTYTISSTRNLPKFLFSLNLTSPPPHISTCRSIDRSIQLSSNNTRRSFSPVIEIHSVPSSLNARVLRPRAETRHPLKLSNAIIAIKQPISLSSLNLNRPPRPFLLSFL